jgi:hypothetical protein
LFGRCFVVKQFGQFFGHGSAAAFGIDNRYRAAVIFYSLTRLKMSR